MRRLTAIFQLAVGLLWLAGTAARIEAQPPPCPPVPGSPVPCKVTNGTTEGGADYIIAIPYPLSLWNGDLVIWNHGLEFVPSTGPLGPLAPIQLGEGYAVAASSYQQDGWALFKTKNDLQHLVNVFKGEFGTPGQVFLVGASLGGIVTAQAIEEANLGNVVGALPFCGALAGSRNWDAALDLRLIYDAVCSEVSGAFIPGGAEGLPAGSTLTENDIFAALNACTGIFAEYPIPQQLARLGLILAETQIPPSFLPAALQLATLGMADLVHNPEKLDGKIGTGNAGVAYDLPFINATIERVSPEPGAHNRLQKHYTPTGAVGDTKIISMHTDQDGLVIVENESEYASVVNPENLTTAIVVEQLPSHCGFTEAEGVAGWESLRAWVAGGQKPSALSIQGLCQALVVQQGFDGPCRIDPSFVIPDMDGRIPPR